MILEIVTPEATLLHSDVESITLPGVIGEFQLLDNHAPIVSLLTEGTVKFKGGNVHIEEQHKDKFKENNGEFKLTIISGTVEMKENKVIVLAD